MIVLVFVVLSVVSWNRLLGEFFDVVGVVRKLRSFCVCVVLISMNSVVVSVIVCYGMSESCSVWWWWMVNSIMSVSVVLVVGIYMLCVRVSRGISMRRMLVVF